MAERSEAGWGLVKRLVDERQHTFQIAIDLIVPETQYAEAFIGQTCIPLRIAPGVDVEIMLAPIDLDDQSVLETDEIHDVSFSWSLPTKVESLFFPGAQMNPQFDLLRGHSLAQAARDLVGHDSPTRPTSLRSVVHPPPLGEGLESDARPKSIVRSPDERSDIRGRWREKNLHIATLMQATVAAAPKHRRDAACAG